ncbi:hypothetical protein LWI28_016230 [Acer negundo]|uniref:Uncharacterized protein n=1 Tax=Acer negundo TaxID=4023 RepID=A0AAD5J548_ACENE|nr:hypothetical protein LWI28_016230 [Acer negundo]
MLTTLKNMKQQQTIPPMVDDLLIRKRNKHSLHRGLKEQSDPHALKPASGNLVKVRCVWRCELVIWVRVSYALSVFLGSFLFRLVLTLVVLLGASWFGY